MENIKGFSLIELMITVAIIGILSLMAIPSYQDYMIRVHLIEIVQEEMYAMKHEVEGFNYYNKSNPHRLMTFGGDEKLRMLTLKIPSKGVKNNDIFLTILNLKYIDSASYLNSSEKIAAKSDNDSYICVLQSSNITQKVIPLKRSLPTVCRNASDPILSVPGANMTLNLYKL